MFVIAVKMFILSILLFAICSVLTPRTFQGEHNHKHPSYNIVATIGCGSIAWAFLSFVIAVLAY